MNEKIEKNPIYLPPFKRFCMTVGELPTSYVETMSYYEMLLWFTKYLGDKVIPAIDNNAEAVDELQKLFVELQNYVNDYFSDLNIQTEINNKLDEMADAGELSEIISLYLNSACIIAFDTISDMASAENLVAGSYAKTFGKSSDDGIGFFYKVRAKVEADTPDGLQLVQLDDASLVAERIVEYMISDTTNPIYYGADPTGTTNSATAINNCIQANKGGVVNFSAGTYLVNNTIILPYKLDEKVSINGNGATIINTEDLTRLIYAGGDKGSLTANDVGFVSYIKDLNIISDNSDTTYCIDVANGFKDLKLYNLRIYRFLNGIRIGESNTSPADVLITDSLLYGKGSEYNGVGIISNCTDNNAEMCRIYGYRKGFVINGGILISRCQVLLRWENQTSANFDPYTRNGVEWNEYYPLTMFAEVNNGCRIIESYGDSTYKFLEINTGGDILFTNNVYFNSREDVDMRLFDFSTEAPMITMNNNSFYCSHYTEGVVIYPQQTFTNFAQISINNTILKRNLNMTNPADIILSSQNGHYNYSVSSPQDEWEVVGAISNNTPYNVINAELYIGGYIYNVRFVSDSSGHISTIGQLLSGESDSRWSLGTVTVGNSEFICVKNNESDTANAKLYIEKIYTDNLTFASGVIKTGSNFVASSRKLSDYTVSTPSNSVRLKQIIF